MLVAVLPEEAKGGGGEHGDRTTEARKSTRASILAGKFASKDTRGEEKVTLQAGTLMNLRMLREILKSRDPVSHELIRNKV